VFFDFDKSDITPEAASILNGAATAYANCGMASVMLAGHTDRAGSPKYNVALAERRNAAVSSYLTGRGVPAARIAGEAFGETKPRVPTADGVREAQNRRVEVTVPKEHEEGPEQSGPFFVALSTGCKGVTWRQQRPALHPCHNQAEPTRGQEARATIAFALVMAGRGSTLIVKAHERPHGITVGLADSGLQSRSAAPLGTATASARAQ
jgi:hypothetical protein